ncbi:hypothetical protein B0H17DRAFT_42797 [Mycena rosella]|uniref:Uncharacterized protein n=1 Tax=Mycena rosella TaxID=1033263 RepID=A0AAD7GF20_MYCRO|nr:hypothetical protein B0H17DRAFT_42797 [Mycena rosella]
MQPAVFIVIIAGGLLFIVVLVITVIYVHRRSRRQMMAGAFDKSAFSITSLTHPRPPLPIYQDFPPPSSALDREAQQHDLVGREVRQQEATYMQLVMDLQRPVSRTESPLPDQAPRELYQPPRRANWEPAPVVLPRSPLPNQTPHELYQPPRPNWDPVQIAPRSPLTAYPAVAPPMPAPPPPVAAPAPKPLSAAQLKRGLSVRSLDSTASEYSVASAPHDAHERSYQPFNLGLPTVPASPRTPITPKWPSSPGSYVWPKRQRASQIREQLAPETYAKVRWRNDESAEPAAAIPVAQALPSATPPATAMRSLSSPTSPGPSLRINVPPPVHYRASFDSTTSATTAQLYYANESTASSSPTLPDFTPPHPVPPRPLAF